MEYVQHVSMLNLKRQKLIGKKELKALCDGSYDVIVPSSGGKDSAFVAYQLKYKYGIL